MARLGPQRVQARGPAAGGDSLLRFPRHGRHRIFDAGGGGGELVVALSRSSLRQSLVSLALHSDGPARLRCRAGRMDDDGGRPPALDCLRAAAHRRFDVALACRRRRAPLVAGLHGGLSDHLPVRGPHRGATGGKGPSVGARDRRADRKRAAACADPCRARAGRQDAMNALNFVPVWTLILGAGIFFYVLLDGFDLGVGMLYNFMPDTRSRNLVMNAIAPVWDGNETWLVMGGVALLAAFPLAFAILIPALYFPILVMLLALV